MVNKSTTKSNTGLAMISIYRGLQSSVASRLGVSRQFVSAVVHGRKRSSKVEVALRSEMKRIERRLAA